MKNNSTQNSEISEAIFMAEALKLGWRVSKPVGHAQPFDFVIRRPGKKNWETIQVKKSYIMTNLNKYSHSREIVRVNRPHNKKYKLGDYDALAIVNIDTHKTRVIPWKKVKGSRELVTSHYDKHLIN